MDRNQAIWDDLYAGGNFMWYPSEVLVGLVRRQEKCEGLRGVILDHGAGSGNVAEFLVRSGHTVHCTDISEKSLEVIDRRFRVRALPVPAMSQIDPMKPLHVQLPRFDHVIAWHSLYYNTAAKLRDDIETLIGGLPKGGVFIAGLWTLADSNGATSEPLPDGSRRLRGSGEEQAGAVIAVPKDLDELLTWCSGLEIRDALAYRLDARDSRRDQAIVYGVKA
jgi:SAM-dependent methyltransferase